MKKLAAVFLIFSILFSVSFSAIAVNENNENITDSTSAEDNGSEDIILPPAEDENEVESETEDSENNTDEEIHVEEAVVRMWICSSYLGYFPTGHTWLYFENLTQEPVLIGIYELLPESGVSVGTFGNQLKGFGVYYNIETHKGTPSDTHTLCTDLSSDEVQTVSDSIINHNYWGLVHNCVFSATRIWNTVSETRAVYTFFPLFSMLDIRIKEGEISSLIMKTTSKDEVFRLKKVEGVLTLICCNDYLKD